jgi:hypothetical protein
MRGDARGVAGQIVARAEFHQIEVPNAPAGSRDLR